MVDRNVSINYSFTIVGFGYPAVYGISQTELCFREPATSPFTQSRATSHQGPVARRSMMVSMTVQGTNVFAPQVSENEERFLRRMAFYDQCMQWIHEFERTMLARDVSSGMSGLSMQFSSNFSSNISTGIAEFRWRNLTFCVLHIDLKTNTITTPFMGIVKQRFDALKQESQFNGVKMLRWFLVEVVKNEISKLAKFRDALVE